MSRPAKVPKASGSVQPVPGQCVICGCTEAAACPGGCAWIDETELICSEHSDEEIAAARAKLAAAGPGKKRKGGRARTEGRKQASARARAGLR